MARRLFGSLRRSRESKDAVSRRHSAGPVYAFTGNPYDPDWDLDRIIKDAYERVIWVHRVVDARAVDASRIPVVVREGAQPDAKPIPDHYLLPLLNKRANPYETARVFRHRLHSQWQLSKKGVFVEVTENPRGDITGLYLLNPLHTFVVPDPDVFIGGFEMRLPSGEVFKGPEDLPVYRRGYGKGVVWLRNPHPTDPYSSQTWVEAAGLSIDMDFYARLYQRTFMQNDGRPGGLIAIDGEVDEEFAAALQARLSGGVGSAGKISVVGDAEHVHYIDTSVTPRDAQYKESREMTRGEILIAGGTPLSVLGDASGRTYDNADAEEEVYWRKTQVPDMELIASFFDLLTDGGWDDDEFVGYDFSGIAVLQREQRAREAQAQAEWDKGLISIDEYREVTGKEPKDVPASRALWMAAGKTPVADDEDFAAIQAQYGGAPAAGGEEGGQGALPGGQQPPALPGSQRPALPSGRGDVVEGEVVGDDFREEDAAAEPAGQMPLNRLPSLRELLYAEGKARPPFAGAAEKAATGSSRVDPASLEAARRHAEDLIGEHLAAVQTAIAGVYLRQEATVLARLTGAKARRHTRHWDGKRPTEFKVLDPGYVLDRARWIGDLVDAVVHLVLDAFAAAGWDSMRRLGADAANAERLRSEAAKIVVADTIAGMAEAFDETAGRIQEVIRTADEEGLDISAIADRVRDAYLRADTWAERQAQPVIGAMNAASLIGAVESGAVYKRWLATDDDRTRPSHRAAEGQVVGVGEPFQVGKFDLDYPGDRSNPEAISEWIACRCSMLFQATVRTDDFFDATLDEDLAELEQYEGKARIGRVDLRADVPELGGWWANQGGFREALVIRDEQGRFVDRLGIGGINLPEGAVASAAPDATEARRRAARDWARKSGIADWETTKPWERTAADIEAGRVPGIQMRRDAVRGFTAHWTGDAIEVNETYGTVAGPEGLRDLLYHEAGHAVASEVIVGRDVGPLLAPFRRDGGSRYVSPFGSSPDRPHGHSDEPAEILADAYMMLATGKGGVYGDTPGVAALYDEIEAAARLLGFPLRPRTDKPGPPTWDDWRQVEDGRWVRRPDGDMIAVTREGRGKWRWGAFAVLPDGREPSAQGIATTQRAAQADADAAWERITAERRATPEESEPTAAKPLWAMTPEEFEAAGPWVWHAASYPEHRDLLTTEGVRAENVPMNLARQRFQAGEAAEYAPGAGVGMGLYVAGDAWRVTGYGRYLFAIQAGPEDLEVPPESTVPGASVERALKDHNGALLVGDIPPERVHFIGQAYYEGQTDHWYVVFNALKRGEPVPEDILALYPDMPDRLAAVGGPDARASDQPAMSPVADLPGLPADLAEWETTKPWNTAKEDVRLGRVPWAVYTPRGHGEDASHGPDGRIRLTDKFFDHPEGVRRAIMYHEAGHALSDAMLSDGSGFDLFDLLPEVRGRREFNGHTTPGEAAAEAYSVLNSPHPEDREWAQRMGVEAYLSAVADRAATEGMPILWRPTDQPAMSPVVDLPVQSPIDPAVTFDVERRPSALAGGRVRGVVTARVNGQGVGLLSWDASTGEIIDVRVDSPWRRRGIATQMLTRAREEDPRVHHSENLSPDGAAFATAVQSPVVDLPGPLLPHGPGQYLGTDRNVDPPAPDLNSRLGRCYELAATAVVWPFDNPTPEGSVLVQGTMRGPGSNRRIGHAWVELPNGDVWEPAKGEVWPRQAWIAIAKPREVNRYTASEARRLMVTHGHYGPWENVDALDPRYEDDMLPEEQPMLSPLVAERVDLAALDWQITTGRREAVLTARDEAGTRVGELAWAVEDGVIAWLWVREDSRRQGVGTELLRRAREVDLRVKHDYENLSEDGAEFAAAVKSPVPDEVGKPLHDEALDAAANLPAVLPKSNYKRPIAVGHRVRDWYRRASGEVIAVGRGTVTVRYADGVTDTVRSRRLVHEPDSFAPMPPGYDRYGRLARPGAIVTGQSGRVGVVQAVNTDTGEVTVRFGNQVRTGHADFIVVDPQKPVDLRRATTAADVEEGQPVTVVSLFQRDDKPHVITGTLVEKRAHSTGYELTVRAGRLDTTFNVPPDYVLYADPKPVNPAALNLQDVPETPVDLETPVAAAKEMLGDDPFLIGRRMTPLEEDEEAQRLQTLIDNARVRADGYRRYADGEHPSEIEDLDGENFLPPVPVGEPYLDSSFPWLSRQDALDQAQSWEDTATRLTAKRDEFLAWLRLRHPNGHRVDRDIHPVHGGPGEQLAATREAVTEAGRAVDAEARRLIVARMEAEGVREDEWYDRAYRETKEAVSRATAEIDAIRARIGAEFDAAHPDESTPEMARPFREGQREQFIEDRMMWTGDFARLNEAVALAVSRSIEILSQKEAAKGKRSKIRAEVYRDVLSRIRPIGREDGEGPAHEMTAAEIMQIETVQVTEIKTGDTILVEGHPSKVAKIEPADDDPGVFVLTLTNDDHDAYRPLVVRLRKGAVQRVTAVPQTVDNEIVEAIGHAEDWYPTDWLRQSADRGPLQIARADRGFYSDHHGLLSLSGEGSRWPDAPPMHRVATHELAHRMEYSVPGIRPLEWAFFFHRTTRRKKDGTLSLDKSGFPIRTGKNAVVTMAQATGTPMYHAQEETRPDDFPEPYSGKVYGTEHDKQAWELLSTIMESLFSGSDYADDEMRAFALGLLATV